MSGIALVIIIISGDTQQCRIEMLSPRGFLLSTPSFTFNGKHIAEVFPRISLSDNTTISDSPNIIAPYQHPDGKQYKKARIAGNISEQSIS